MTDKCQKIFETFFFTKEITQHKKNENSTKVQHKITLHSHDNKKAKTKTNTSEKDTQNKCKKIGCLTPKKKKKCDHWSKIPDTTLQIDTNTNSTSKRNNKKKNPRTEPQAKTQHTKKKMTTTTATAYTKKRQQNK